MPDDDRDRPPRRRVLTITVEQDGRQVRYHILGLGLSVFAGKDAVALADPVANRLGVPAYRVHELFMPPRNRAEGKAWRNLASALKTIAAHQRRLPALDKVVAAWNDWMAHRPLVPPPGEAHRVHPARSVSDWIKALMS
jgi:hypothetical protein